MLEKIDFLRNMENIIIPYSFTYLNHSTSYIPEELKQRAERGKYMHNWSTLPVDNFTVEKEMSFVERDQRIKDALEYNKPLSDVSIIYQLKDYSKPFMIRVIIPKLDYVRSGALGVSEEYKSELMDIYRGYGDMRHPKLASGEKIYIFGNSSTDEVSGKVVDIFYGIREKDVDLYLASVLQTQYNGYTTDLTVNLSTFDEFGRNKEFYPESYALPKEYLVRRYAGKPSEFELELYNDYKDVLDKEGELPALSVHDAIKYIDLYEKYKNKKVVGR